MKLACQIAIVTGGGSGIGRAACLRLAAEGAAVAVADLRLDAARETVNQIAAAGGRAQAFEVDVASVTSVRAMVEAVEATLGAVDLLVNNAGWDRLDAFLNTDEELWDRILGINLKGQIACAHAVLKRMVERRRGRIICVASDAGRVGSSGEVVYSAAKGGVIAFTKALAREAARHGVLVNCVAPGLTDTPLLKAVSEGPSGERIIEAVTKATPLRRLARPEEIAGAIAFLASEDSAFMTGQTLSVSGGLTMI